MGRGHQSPKERGFAGFLSLFWCLLDKDSQLVGTSGKVSRIVLHSEIILDFGWVGNVDNTADCASVTRSDGSSL